MLVGVTQACDAPAGVSALPKVSGVGGVQFERLLALKPDLVVVWPGGNRPQDIARLAELNIPMVESAPRVLSDIATDVRTLGRALGTQAHAETEAQRIEAALRSIKPMANATAAPVFYQLGAGHLYTLNGAHAVSDALARCGARNVFAHLSLLAPHVSAETVARATPAVIVLANPSDETEVRAYWQRHAALFGGRAPPIVVADGQRLHRPTPRAIEAVQPLCDAIAAAIAR